MSTVTISAADINNLRKQTGAGMLDCRAALQETGGDFEAAIDYLRKKGQKVAAKRSDRDANEGVVIAKTSADNTVGIVVNLTSETDFVSKNEDFQQVGLAISEVAIANNCKTIEELKAAPMGAGTVNDKLLDMLAAIGEKIDITILERVEAASVTAYNHGAYRVGVLIGMNKPHSEAMEALGRDLAMQSAAMSPLAIDSDGISTDMIAREKAIIIEMMTSDPKMAGKPADMIEKIAEGKLNAFFKENTLTSQVFVKDSSKTVADHVASVGGADLKVVSMVRKSIG
jgi:elongation factor Ts